MDNKKKQQTADEKLKYEIAQELGLLEKVEKEGWKGLSAKETGKIGGIMNQRTREREKNNLQI